MPVLQQKKNEAQEIERGTGRTKKDNTKDKETDEHNMVSEKRGEDGVKEDGGEGNGEDMACRVLPNGGVIY